MYTENTCCNSNWLLGEEERSREWSWEQSRVPAAMREGAPDKELSLLPSSTCLVGTTKYHTEGKYKTLNSLDKGQSPKAALPFPPAQTLAPAPYRQSYWNPFAMLTSLSFPSFFLPSILPEPTAVASLFPKTHLNNLNQLFWLTQSIFFRLTKFEILNFHPNFRRKKISKALKCLWNGKFISPALLWKRL